MVKKSGLRPPPTHLCAGIKSVLFPVDLKGAVQMLKSFTRKRKQTLSAYSRTQPNNKQNQNMPNCTKQYQTGPNRKKPNHTKPNHTKPTQTKPNQANSYQIKTHATKRSEGKRSENIQTSKTSNMPNQIKTNEKHPPPSNFSIQADVRCRRSAVAM